MIGSYETFLNGTNLELPDVVLPFWSGADFEVAERVSGSCPAGAHIQVNESGVWADDLHRTTDFVQSASRVGIRRARYVSTPKQRDAEWTTVARARSRDVGSDRAGDQFWRRLRRRVRLRPDRSAAGRRAPVRGQQPADPPRRSVRQAVGEEHPRVSAIAARAASTATSRRRWASPRRRTIRWCCWSATSRSTTT